ncbi:MAG: DUF998 domain-containing protein [Promethearchaeota archaeon]
MVQTIAEKYWREFLIISFSSIVLFIFFLTMSMLFYPDGSSSIGYNGYDGYSFWNNFISDLGMTHTFKGNSNSISPLFLLAGIVILSIGGSLFYLLTFIIFSNEDKNSIRLSAIVATSGIVSLIFLLGVSIFPKDTYPQLHELTSTLFFLLTFAAIIIYNYLIHLQENISDKYTITGYIFIICSLIYVLVPKLIFPQLDDETQSIFKPVSQKVAVISLLVALVNYIWMVIDIKSE